MRIVIDLLACQTDSRDRGIGRYAFGLVEALAKLLNESDELIIALDNVDAIRTRDVRHKLRANNVRAKVVSIEYPAAAPTDFSPNLVKAASLLRTEFFRALNPDVLLISSFFEAGTAHTTEIDFARLAPIKTAVVAYDLIPLRFSDYYLPPENLRTTWYHNKAVQFSRFDCYLAISKATKTDLIDFLDITEQRISVIDAGLDNAFRKCLPNPDVSVLREHGIVLPYVLNVGNADWRKNSIGALHAFALLPDDIRRSHQLVFVQVGEDVTDALANDYRHLSSQVIVTGKVSEAVLAQLYLNCRVFFFPSYCEGFGLPVIEAMATGAAVLSSSGGALAEVIHHQDALFDPADAQTASGLLCRTLKDKNFHDHLLENAREHALSYSWENCAQKALTALRRVAAPSSHREWEPSKNDISVLADAIPLAAKSEAALRHALQAIAAAGKRRVLIDITEIVRLDARSGIQRVVRNYVRHLHAISKQQDAGFIVEPICWTIEGMRYARQYVRTHLDCDCPGPDAELHVQCNDIAFMADSSWWTPERYDAFHSEIHAVGGEVVWMVYDLVPVYWPQCCDPGMPPAFRAWLDWMLRTADGCICISEATRQDLLRYAEETLPPGTRIPWSRGLHLGSDAEPGKATLPTGAADQALGQLGERPWALALSTVEPRKDYGTILGAYEFLWSQGSDIGLVIVGKQGWNVEALATRIRNHKENGKRLFWLEKASDGDVGILMEKAGALIQASIAEGYGLAVAEAGQRGIPLILSDLPVFREIAGDGATYFPAGNLQTLAEKLAVSLNSGMPSRLVPLATMNWKQSSAELLWILLN